MLHAEVPGAFGADQLPVQGQQAHQCQQKRRVDHQGQVLRIEQQHGREHESGQGQQQRRRLIQRQPRQPQQPYHSQRQEEFGRNALSLHACHDHLHGQPQRQQVRDPARQHAQRHPARQDRGGHEHAEQHGARQGRHVLPFPDQRQPQQSGMHGGGQQCQRQVRGVLLFPQSVNLLRRCGGAGHGAFSVGGSGAAAHPPPLPELRSGGGWAWGAGSLPAVRGPGCRGRAASTRRVRGSGRPDRSSRGAGWTRRRTRRPEGCSLRLPGSGGRARTG